LPRQEPAQSQTGKQREFKVGHHFGAQSRIVISHVGEMCKQRRRHGGSADAFQTPADEEDAHQSRQAT
jgi:hypothetical protein